MIIPSRQLRLPSHQREEGPVAKLTVNEGQPVSSTELDAAVRQEGLYSIIGVIVGGLIALIGLWFIVAGIGGTTPPIKIPLPGGTNTFDVPALPTGIAVFAAGVAIIWITRPTVAKG
jgi:hypothetical protein